MMRPSIFCLINVIGILFGTANVIRLVSPFEVYINAAAVAICATSLVHRFHARP